MTYRSWPDLAIQLREVLKVPGLGPTYDTGKVIPEWLSRSMDGRAGLLGCLWLEVMEESSWPLLCVSSSAILTSYVTWLWGLRSCRWRFHISCVIFCVQDLKPYPCRTEDMNYILTVLASLCFQNTAFCLTLYIPCPVLKLSPLVFLFQWLYRNRFFTQGTFGNVRKYFVTNEDSGKSFKILVGRG